MKRSFSWPVLTVLAFLLSGCAASPTFLQPGSGVAADEANLYQIIFFMALGVFLLVWLMLIFNIVRFRSRPGQTGIPKQKYGNWRLEFVWTAIPILLVLILFVLTIRTIGAVAEPEKAPNDVNVHIIGHQWWWEFDYPDQNIKTANELHVPVGANVHLTLDSVDVIHSFWVPQLSHKIDVIPGQTNHLWFRAFQMGEFSGQCAEFCGLNHANMRIRVVVDSNQQFVDWIAGQQTALYQPANPTEQKGHDIITKGICSNCHTLGDNEANNPIGPNLTHLMSRSMFAGDMYPLTPDNLKSWLQDTQAMKPGNDMVINLSPEDIDAVMAYLLQLK